MGEAGDRALAQHVERPPRLTQPSHAVMDAARSQSLLGKKPSPSLPMRFPAGTRTSR